MAITAVNPMFTDTGAEDDSGFQFTKQWLVKTNSHATGEMEVLNAPGIPAKGALHKSRRAQVTSKRADRHADSDLVWVVTVSYSVKPNADGSPGASPSDTNFGAPNIPTMTLSYERAMVARPHDFRGYVLQTSASEPFDGGDEVDVSNLTITLSHQIEFKHIDEALINKWRDTVHGRNFAPIFMQEPTAEAMAKLTGAANMPKFFGFPAFVPRLVDLGASMSQEDEPLSFGKVKVTMWNINVKFVMADMWLGSALDMGFITNKATGVSEGLILNAGPAAAKPILDAHGMPVTRPVKLNGRGELLKKFEKPWWLVWQRYRHDDLNNLLRALRLPRRVIEYRVRRN